MSKLKEFQLETNKMLEILQTSEKAVVKIIVADIDNKIMKSTAIHLVAGDELRATELAIIDYMKKEYSRKYLDGIEMPELLN